MGKAKKKKKLERNKNPDIQFGEPIKNIFYDCFTIENTVDYVKAKFERKFGKPPEKIFQHKSLIWAGPIRKNGELHKYNRDGVHG